MLALPLVTGAGAYAEDRARLERARAEGRVVWLTTQVVGELAQPIAGAFKAAYGIDVTLQRGTVRQMGERLVQAARTPQTGIDVVDGRSAIPHLKRAGLLAPLDIAVVRGLSPELADRDGFWVATNLFFNAVVVNTEMVAPERRPASLEDLLHPQWKDRMAWSAQSTVSAGAGFIGTMLRDRGEAATRDFLSKLALQNIASLDVSSRQIIDKVSAGQFDLGLQVFHHQAAISGRRGAPVDWLPLGPMAGSAAVVAVTRQSPHPNAARMFVEFLVSRKGQEIFREADYIPAMPGISAKETDLLPASGRFRPLYFTPEEIESGMPEWQKLRVELVR